MTTNPTSTPVKHCVLMKFMPATPPDTRAGIFARLQLLRQKNLGILDMVNGTFLPSPSGPTGLNRNYTDGLVVTFASEDDRNNYNVDPDHQAILQVILANLDGGTAGLLRFDFAFESPQPLTHQ